MDQETKDQLAIGLANAPKKLTTWVMSAAATVFSIFLLLPAAQQTELISHLPLPVWVFPIIFSVIGIVAGMWPQTNLKRPPTESPPTDSGANTDAND